MFQNPEQAFGGTAPMLGLIEDIYAAVQTPDLWGGVMQGIAQALGGESLAMFAGFADTRTTDLIAVEQMAAGTWADYAGHYATINPIMARCERTFAMGTTWLSDRAIGDAALEKTEFYNDFFKPNDMHYSAGLRVPLEGASVVNLSCQRSKRLGAFGDRANIVYQALKPHLQRALILHQKMSTMQAALLGLETALDAHEHAVLGLDGLGSIVLCNPHAQALLQAAAGVRLVQGRLCCTMAKDTRALQTVLSAVLAGSAGGAMLAHRTSGPPLRVVISPFRAAVPGTSTPLAALVFLSDPSLAVQSRSATMRALYGLTPTEARVADLLLEGLEIRNLTERLHVSLETARFHVKRVLTKTGTRKQSDLIRIMLALPVQG